MNSQEWTDELVREQAVERVGPDGESVLEQAAALIERGDVAADDPRVERLRRALER